MVTPVAFIYFSGLYKYNQTHTKHILCLYNAIHCYSLSHLTLTLPFQKSKIVQICSNVHTPWSTYNITYNNSTVISPLWRGTGLHPFKCCYCEHSILAPWGKVHTWLLYVIRWFNGLRLMVLLATALGVVSQAAWGQFHGTILDPRTHLSMHEQEVVLHISMRS